MAQAIPTDIITAAQAAQARYFVPSSVSIAQWAIESAWGLHFPKGSNNPFGIKAQAGQAYVSAMTWEVVEGRSVRMEARFAKYGSLGEAFDAHAHLLGSSHLYKPAMDAWYHDRDLETGISLMAQHYATDPAYATKLLSIIHQNGLVQYDSLPQDRARKAAGPAPAAAPRAPLPPQAQEDDPFAPLKTILADTVGSVIAPAGPSLGDSALQPAATESSLMNPLLAISIIQQIIQYAPQVEHVITHVPDIVAKGKDAIAALEKLDFATAVTDAKAIAADLGISQEMMASVVSHATHAPPPAKAA